MSRSPPLRAAAIALLGLALTTGPARAQVPERRPSEPISTDPWIVPVPPDTTPLPAPVAVEDEAPRPWLVDLAGFYGLTIERYNRTTGLVPAWGLTLESTAPARRPSLGGWIGTPTTGHRAYWTGWVEQRLPIPGTVTLRLEHVHHTATFDDWKVTQRENDLSTLLAGRDHLDWWRERGWRLTLAAETEAGRFGGGVSFVDADQRSVRNHSPWTLFGEDFRSNPEVAEGVLHGLLVSGRIDTRDVQSPLLPSPGWRLDVEWERAGGVLGGDVTFTRGSADLRRYIRLGRDAWWDGRIFWTGALTGRGVPPQRSVSLGGPGSLRGFPAASFVGDEGVQASTELRLPLPVHRRIAFLFIQWHWVGFVDVGAVDDYDAWHADVGTGVSGINLFSYLGLFVAQRVTDLDARDSGPRFVVRLRRDF